MARRRNTGGKVIDQTFWVGVGAAFPAQSAGAVAVANQPLSALATVRTIMRTRLNIVSYIDTASAPGKQVEIAVGGILVPEGTGTTVLWSPITDANAPWFFYTRFVIGYEEMVTDVIDIPGISSYREMIDSKAMRRVKADTETQIVVENATILTAASVNTVVTGRVLVGT